MSGSNQTATGTVYMNDELTEEEREAVKDVFTLEASGFVAKAEGHIFKAQNGKVGFGIHVGTPAEAFNLRNIAAQEAAAYQIQKAIANAKPTDGETPLGLDVRVRFMSDPKQVAEGEMYLTGDYSEAERDEVRAALMGSLDHHDEWEIEFRETLVADNGTAFDFRVVGIDNDTDLHEPEQLREMERLVKLKTEQLVSLDSWGKLDIYRVNIYPHERTTLELKRDDGKVRKLNKVSDWWRDSEGRLVVEDLQGEETIYPRYEVVREKTV